MLCRITVITPDFGPGNGSPTLPKATNRFIDKLFINLNLKSMKYLVFIFTLMFGISFVSCKTTTETTDSADSVEVDTVIVDSIISDTVAIDSIL